MRSRTTTSALRALVSSTPLLVGIVACEDTQFTVASDAAAEADAGDAGDAGAQASDGSATSDAPVGQGFCGTSKHAFCADFDGVNPLQDWFPAKRGNGVIGLDPLAASAPNSTVFLLPATSAAASLTIGLPPAAKGAHVVCRFDVRIGSIDPVRDIGMVGLTASDPSLKSYEVRVAISTARSYTDERGELTSSNMVSGNIDGQTLPVDSWQTITLDAALQAGKGRLIVRAGSVQLAYLTLHAPVGTFDTLRIGAEPNDTLTGKTEFRFDNVACDVLPPLN